MASELLTQSTIGGTTATLTSANYLEGKVSIPSPDSLLDLQVIVTEYGGLSVRDLFFCLTAYMTIRAALKVSDITMGKLKKRKKEGK
jgi:hypothetical protein